MKRAFLMSIPREISLSLPEGYNVEDIYSCNPRDSSTVDCTRESRCIPSILPFVGRDIFPRCKSLSLKMDVFRCICHSRDFAKFPFLNATHVKKRKLLVKGSNKA